MSCTATAGGASQSTVVVTYTGNDILTVTYFELELYAITSGALGSPGDYTLTVYLPQYVSTYVPFGTSYTSSTEYCSCQSTFKVGNTAYGTSMVFDSLSTLSLQNSVMTPISFNFGSYSYREIFFDSSFFQFNFGFLTTPVSTAIGNSNFKCLVFENNNNVLTLSDKWKKLDLSSLNSVKLYPKA